MTNTSSLPNRTNTTLWILLGSFLLPAIIAYMYFFFGDKPPSHSNGELVTPIVDIETLKLTDLSGNTLTREELTPKWRMYYFVNASCNEVCQADLYNMRQINIALGKNQDRVQHVIVHLAPADEEFLALLNTEHQQAIRVAANAEDSSALIASQTAATDQAHFIYLMDPLGNVMMKFPQNLNPKLILKDINKLLKISRIG